MQMDEDFTTMPLPELFALADVDVRTRWRAGAPPLPSPLADEETRQRVKAARRYIHTHDLYPRETP